MKTDVYQPGAVSDRCRRVGVHAIVLAALAIGLAPVDLVADFFFAWAAVGGDTGVPPTPGATDRETLCLVLAAAAALLGAIALYRSNGYEVSSMSMRKRL